MTDDTCGHPTQAGGECQHPTTDDGDPERCWIPSHGGGSDNHGRPSSFDDDKREAIYSAVGTGLKANHVAAAAGISVQTLRRWLCCISDLAEAELEEDPCDFCKGYARAHADGAREVLEDTSAEFRASASFGYRKTERQEVTGEDGSPVTIEVSEEVADTWPE